MANGNGVGASRIDSGVARRATHTVNGPAAQPVARGGQRKASGVSLPAERDFDVFEAMKKEAKRSFDSFFVHRLVGGLTRKK